jgi:hypothetical protein
VIEEEAAWFWALWLENDENQLRFHLDLEILARIFHAFHCHFKDNGYAGLQELHSPKLLFSLLCCFLFRFSFPPLPADSSFYVKRLLL